LKELNNCHYKKSKKFEEHEIEIISSDDESEWSESDPEEHQDDHKNIFRDKINK
jgi:hypothetical protein